MHPYDRETPGRCAWCGDYATRVVELTVSRKAGPGERRNRGEYLGSKSQRACDDCAAAAYNAIKSPQKRPKREH